MASSRSKWWMKDRSPGPATGWSAGERHGGTGAIALGSSARSIFGMAECFGTSATCGIGHRQHRFRIAPGKTSQNN